MASPRPGGGQTALVTGASGGIGVDLADCFARDGYDVIVTARSQAALEQVAARLAREHSVTATPIACDLAEAGGARKLAQAVTASGLGVDVLVNNAGFGHAGPFTSTDLATQVGMIDLNVRALVELTHLHWDGMRQRRRGGVLNVASTAAFQPGPFMAVYYASKAFVLSFSEALWEEARGTGVKVSCLCPGPTMSGFRARAGTDKTKLAAAARQVPSMPVAEAGYRAFQNDERVCVTGTRNKVVAKLVPMLPRRTVLRMVRELQSPR